MKLTIALNQNKKVELTIRQPPNRKHKLDGSILG